MRALKFEVRSSCLRFSHKTRSISPLLRSCQFQNTKESDNDKRPVFHSAALTISDIEVVSGFMRYIYPIVVEESTGAVDTLWVMPPEINSPNAIENWAKAQRVALDAQDLHTGFGSRSFSISNGGPLIITEICPAGRLIAKRNDGWSVYSPS